MTSPRVAGDALVFTRVRTPLAVCSERVRQPRTDVDGPLTSIRLRLIGCTHHVRLADSDLRFVTKRDVVPSQAEHFSFAQTRAHDQSEDEEGNSQVFALRTLRRFEIQLGKRL